MNETNNMLSMEFILQGSDVVISIFIIVAMSFVPASFTLFLVYERATKSKHIQYINGLYPLVYWITNFVWDLLNYLIPAACVIIILRLFNVPAYVEGENFLAVISLFLMYGWAIIPVMYPFSFRFTEPSNAYIFLIVSNLFSGITCIYTSFFLEMFALGSPTASKLNVAARTMKRIFRIFPNYCLGRGLIAIAYNVSSSGYRIRKMLSFIESSETCLRCSCTDLSILSKTQLCHVTWSSIVHAFAPM